MYFFDRNGYAFRYIMEFYRTGKLLLSERDKDKVTFVTLDEIEKEIEYFRIPVTEKDDDDDDYDDDDEDLMLDSKPSDKSNPRTPRILHSTEENTNLKKY